MNSRTHLIDQIIITSQHILHTHIHTCVCTAPLKAPRSFNQGLATWSRNYDTYPTGALISQYMVMPHTPDCGVQKSLAGGGHVWLLPFRQPHIDADDHLRLQYWDGNEALKGAAIPLRNSTLVVNSAAAAAAATALTKVI